MTQINAGRIAMELAGRVAIVTGAGKGMGPTIAATLAREGADLMLCGRDLAAIGKVSEDMRSLGRRTHLARCDVCKASDVDAMVGDALRALGGHIDILVNAAGGTGPVERSTLDTAPQEFDDVVAVNMRGVYLTIRAVLPTMMAQRYGKIVNVGGTWGLHGRALRMAYSASKWGLRGITKSVALEAGPCNINVNNVCPGIVEGPRVENTFRIKSQRSGKPIDQVRMESEAECALRRFSTAQDVANVIAFLCTDRSRQITGQDIAVDGGWAI
jgi:NAD(P)-dependent dehydrogenase (short-subunit alcohol dehydrogenase family)